MQRPSRFLRPVPLLTVLGTVTLLAGGCGDGGEECAGTPRAGLVVRVVDAATGDPVCGVTVVATDGDYEEELFPPQADCTSESAVHTGAYDRPGIYTVSALDADGQVLATAQAEVIPIDACRVASTWVTLEVE